ncbi:putative glucosylceramidase 4 [Epargyreus clarus]|uniref:putative glucosylceramidase 4 n=1 Tax=Epargyreus clarus TaxID=520877 RepID=UPI003C2FFBE8
MPMIFASQKVAMEKIMVFATTWSPPPWMKSNNAFSGHSRLLKTYYQTYADYHCLFAEKYKEQGIDIWGFTTTNEPLDGVFDIARFQTLGFNASGMGEYIQNHLGPTLRYNCSVKNLGIMAVDDQRVAIPLFFNALNENFPGSMEYINGIAVHWYTDTFTPASLLSDVTRDYPDKFLMSTEACAGYRMSDFPKVDLGSWDRANDYVTDIIQNLRNKASGWVDWNLCLDFEGGPNWSKNYVDAAIIVDPLADEFYKQPTFYALAHFSKFLPPGSRRISVIEASTEMNSNYFFDSEDAEPNYDYVAFLTPRNTIVVILHNKGDYKTVTIQLGDQHIVTTLEPESVSTIEFQYDASMIYRDMPGYVEQARS